MLAKGNTITKNSFKMRVLTTRKQMLVSNVGMGDTKKFMSRYIMTEIITIIDIITV